MTDPTIEERIERLRRYLPLEESGNLEEALAIIDELQARYMRGDQQSIDYMRQLNGIIIKQQREIERLEAQIKTMEHNRQFISTGKGR